MLCIPWMVILSGHNIKKQVSKTSIFELPRLKKLHEQVVYRPLGAPPPPPDLIPKLDDKNANTA